MPDGFPTPLSLGRDKLCTMVLNDNYTSLPQGSESFKFKAKNINEDNLFKIEDQMYDIDIQICNF